MPLGALNLTRIAATAIPLHLARTLDQTLARLVGSQPLAFTVQHAMILWALLALRHSHELGGLSVFAVAHATLTHAQPYRCNDQRFTVLLG